MDILTLLVNVGGIDDVSGPALFSEIARYNRYLTVN